MRARVTHRGDRCGHWRLGRRHGVVDRDAGLDPTGYTADPRDGVAVRRAVRGRRIAHATYADSTASQPGGHPGHPRLQGISRDDVGSARDAHPGHDDARRGGRGRGRTGIRLRAEPAAWRRCKHRCCCGDRAAGQPAQPPARSDAAAATDCGATTANRSGRRRPGRAAPGGTPETHHRSANTCQADNSFRAAGCGPQPHRSEGRASGLPGGETHRHVRC